MDLTASERLTTDQACFRAGEKGVSMTRDKLRRRMQTGEIKGGRVLDRPFVWADSLDAFIERELAKSPTADPAA